jgi:TonB family protein
MRKLVNYIIILALSIIIFGCSGLTIIVVSDQYEIIEETPEGEINYKEKPFSGEILKYYDNGQLCYEVNYKKGKLDGVWKKYYKDGGLECKGIYKDNELDGYWESYYSNDQLSVQKNYKNGKLDGPYKSYFDYGFLKVVGNYTKGIKDGVWEYYNGDALNEDSNKNSFLTVDYYLAQLPCDNQEHTLLKIGIYKDGKKDGIWKYYNQSGLLDSRIIYNEDSILKEEYFIVKGDKILIDENKIFDVVEEIPEFKGGIDKLYEYLNKNISYPKMAKEKGIQGRVFVQFVVWRDGSIGNIKIVRGAHETLDNEAIRVVKNMPKWDPGRLRGKAVNVRFILPIKFKI